MPFNSQLLTNDAECTFRSRLEKKTVQHNKYVCTKQKDIDAQYFCFDTVVSNITLVEN